MLPVQQRLMKHITKEKLFNQQSGTNCFPNTTAYSPGNPTGSPTRLTSPTPLNAHPSIAEAHVELPHPITNNNKQTNNKKGHNQSN